MAPTLYHIPRTISSPIVQCLVELGLVESKSVEIKEISFSDLKTERYLAVNPMGTSPAFHDDSVRDFQGNGIMLGESGAILDYLLERYDTKAKLCPGNISGKSKPEEIGVRAKYLHVKQFILATVYPLAASLYLEKLKPVDQQDAGYVKSATEKWSKVLGPVLAKWLGDGPYYLGAQVSAVDFLVCKPLCNADSMGLLNDFPTLKALLLRIRDRPSFARAYESGKANIPRMKALNILSSSLATKKGQLRRRPMNDQLLKTLAIKSPYSENKMKIKTVS